MRITSCHRASLVMSACAWLVLGCAGGRAGRADARAAGPTPTAEAPDAAEPARALARGVAHGAFIEIQEGDYLHIVIRDRTGSLQSFFIAPALPAPAWEPFLTSRHRGKTVEIAWEEVRIYIPEAGSEETIRRATGIRLIE